MTAMAEERRQNIFVTLATNGLVMRKRNYDKVFGYPLAENLDFEMQTGGIPNDIKIDLGRYSLSLEESESCIATMASALKSHGCKLTNDQDLQYCTMNIDGGPDETLVECMLSFVVKG